MDEAYHDREAVRYDEYLNDERMSSAENWIAPLLVEEVGAGTIIDLGCGTGRIAELLVRRGRNVIAVDRSRAMLAATATKVASPRIVLLRADARRLPLASGSADGIVCAGLLHHVRDWRAVVREAARVLRPGGRLVLREPNAGYAEKMFAPVEHSLDRIASLCRRNSDAAAIDERAPYERPIDLGELDAELRRLPFRAKWIRTTMLFGSLLLPRGIAGKQPYYAFANAVDRWLFSSGFAGGHGALLIAVLTKMEAP